VILALACITPATQEVAVAEDRNRLGEATSPYLLQHADNPVHWYEWGPDAFARAKELDRPIFLSIGYAACHWCHVMAHESFEDPEVAALMNERFVNIKVDREERPDVDALYMEAVHTLNDGHGGWPASIWLDTDLRPFYAGTYFPPEPSYGRASFTQTIDFVSEVWTTDRARVNTVAAALQEGMTSEAILEPAPPPEDDLGPRAVVQLAEAWDEVHQGFRSDKKFPMTPRLQLLAVQSAQDDPVAGELLREGLLAMANGGIYDHLGGGFHRYTVDPTWTVPHFEKMLYDNAQLVGLYAQAHVVFGEPRFAEVARETATYLVRDMEDPAGGYWSSEDADSAGEEGTFYVWTPDEVVEVLGPEEGARFNAAYGVTEQGNFEHNTTVLRREGEAMDEARLRLFTHRLDRVAPPTDTKRVVAWNGLAISGLAQTGRLLGEPRFVESARRAAEAVLARQSEDGRLPRTLADDAPAGVLADYAFFAEGLLDLYEADPDPRWLLAAEATAQAMVRHFQSPTGGFYSAPPEASELFVRQQDPTDGSEPSAWGRAVEVLVRLDAFGSPVADREAAEAALRAAGLYLRRAPYAVPSLVQAHDALRRPSVEIVLTAPSAEDPTLSLFRQAFDNSWRPEAVLVVVTPQTAPDLAHLATVKGKPTDGPTRAYVCLDKVCHLPTEDLDTFLDQLD